MYFESLNILTSGDLAELVFLTIITGVFFTSRRVWLLVEHNKKPAGFKVILKGVVVCSVSGILSYVLNPFILPNYPRLALLLPTILGLWGEQFIDITTNVKKLIKFLKWIRAICKNEEYQEDPDIFETINTDHHKEILDRIISLKLKIEDALIEYRENNDDKIILSCYKETTKEVSMISFEVGEEPQDDLEPILKQRVQELYATNDLLMDARREIIYKHRKEKEANNSDPK